MLFVLRTHVLCQIALHCRPHCLMTGGPLALSWWRASGEDRRCRACGECEPVNVSRLLCDVRIGLLRCSDNQGNHPPWCGPYQSDRMTCLQSRR